MQGRRCKLGALHGDRLVPKLEELAASKTPEKFELMVEYTESQLQKV